MNRRKTTKGLNKEQVKELNEAWYHAKRLNLPLNLLVTFGQTDIGDMTGSERCKLFAALRNRLGVYARQHNFRPTFVWSREINRDGTGEHMHVLIHVPPNRRHHFEDTVAGWLPEPGAVDVRTASYQTRSTASGKRRDAISYISKQMTPQAWYKRDQTRKAGGPVLGKRGGVSANLTRKAIAAWRRDANPFYRFAKETSSRLVTFNTLNTLPGPQAGAVHPDAYGSSAVLCCSLSMRSGATVVR